MRLCPDFPPNPHPRSLACRTHPLPHAIAHINNLREHGILTIVDHGLQLGYIPHIPAILDQLDYIPDVDHFCGGLQLAQLARAGGAAGQGFVDRLWVD
jgi:hypothetical protein